LSSQHGKRTDNNIVDTIDTNNDLPVERPASNPSAAGGGGQRLARPEQAMLELMTQTQRPLLEMINNRDATIQELATELATVKERLRALEAAQASAVKKENPAPVPQVAPTPQPQEPPPPKKGVLGFFKRKPKKQYYDEDGEPLN
jgi:hypothetical protein